MSDVPKKPGGPRKTKPQLTGDAGPEYLDFDVFAEPWSRYKLEDGTNLRVRFVMLRMNRVQDAPTPALRGAAFSSSVLTVVEPPAENRGKPGRPPSGEEIEQHIDRDLTFEALAVAPSIYRFDKDRILVVDTKLVRARRTTLFGPDGDRVYQIVTGSQIAVMGAATPPPPTRLPPSA